MTRLASISRQKFLPAICVAIFLLAPMGEEAYGQSKNAQGKTAIGDQFLKPRFLSATKCIMRKGLLRASAAQSGAERMIPARAMHSRRQCPSACSCSIAGFDGRLILYFCLKMKAMLPRFQQSFTGASSRYCRNTPRHTISPRCQKSQQHFEEARF